jgi:hypothetical protein
MKIAKDIFTCIIIVNLTAYLAFFGTMIFFQPLDEVARPVCAVYWSSFFILLASSTIFCSWIGEQQAEVFLSYFLEFLWLLYFPSYDFKLSNSSANHSSSSISTHHQELI